MNMIEFHKKGENVPQEWYEITKGKPENPFFIFKFLQDCESIVNLGKIKIRTVSGTGLAMEIINANNVNINFLGKGLCFVMQDYSNSLPLSHGSYIKKQ